MQRETSNDLSNKGAATTIESALIALLAYGGTLFDHNGGNAGAGIETEDVTL